MLTRSFNLLLSHRSIWNIQRIYWFDWRDPGRGLALCESVHPVRQRRPS